MVLGVKWSEEAEGITVPYPPMGGKHHGFFDLRGRPELVDTVPEATSSAALRSVLRAAAQSGAIVFTAGCELSEVYAQGGKMRAGGYIHILARDHATLKMPAYVNFLNGMIEQVRDASGADNWAIEVVKAPIRVLLDDDDVVSYSFMFHFHAFAATPDESAASRERLLGALQASMFGAASVVLDDAPRG